MLAKVISDTTLALESFPVSLNLPGLLQVVELPWSSVLWATVESVQSLPCYVWINILGWVESLTQKLEEKSAWISKVDSDGLYLFSWLGLLLGILLILALIRCYMRQAEWVCSQPHLTWFTGVANRAGKILQKTICCVNEGWIETTFPLACHMSHD